MTIRRFKARSKPPRLCIFCGRTGVSGEHIWSDWLAPLLPDAPGSMLEKFSHDPHEKTTSLDYRRSRQGGLKKVKVHAACRRCNSGWMSQLEEDVRPFLTPMVLGHPAWLTTDAQEVVARWLCLKIMVAEHSPAAEPAIPMEAKEAFFRHRTIPRGMSIWLFNCTAASWGTAYYRYAATISTTPTPDFDVRVKNVKGVALGVGQLFAHVTFSGRVDFEYDFEAIPTVAFRVPSRKGFPIAWPPMRPIGLEEARSLSQSFERTFRAPHVKHIRVEP